MRECLRTAGVRANLVQRRDTFASPQFVWLQAVLDQSLRPLNKRVFTGLVNAANRFLETDLDPALLVAEAEAAGQSFFEYWGSVIGSQASPVAQSLSGVVSRLANTRGEWTNIVDDEI